LSIIAACTIIVGLGLIFFGYKVIKFVAFLAGLIVGFTVTYVVIDQHIAPQFDQWGKLGIAAGVGVIIGGLLVFLISAAVFFMGATTGVLICSLVLATPLGPQLFTSGNYLPLLTLGLSALAGGIVSLLLKKWIMMFATAMGGACGIAFMSDCAWLKKHFFNFIPDLIAMKSTALNTNDPWTWGIIGGIIAVTVVGFIFQLYWSNRKPNQEHHNNGYRELRPNV